MSGFDSSVRCCCLAPARPHGASDEDDAQYASIKKSSVFSKDNSEDDSEDGFMVSIREGSKTMHASVDAVNGAEPAAKAKCAIGSERNSGTSTPGPRTEQSRRNSSGVVEGGGDGDKVKPLDSAKLPPRSDPVVRDFAHRAISGPGFRVTTSALPQPGGAGGSRSSTDPLERVLRMDRPLSRIELWPLGISERPHTIMLLTSVKSVEKMGESEALAVKQPPGPDIVLRFDCMGTRDRACTCFEVFRKAPEAVAKSAIKGNRAGSARFSLDSGAGAGRRASFSRRRGSQARAGYGEYTLHSAMKYSVVGIQGDFFLGYRDIPGLADHHRDGKPVQRVLDFGCGCGRSTRFLKGAFPGAEVYGWDVSPEMLAEAQRADPTNNSCYMMSDSPSNLYNEADGHTDLVVSTFVLAEQPTQRALENYLEEAARCLRPGGLLVAVTSREASYNPSMKYLSFRHSAEGAPSDDEKEERDSPPLADFSSGDRLSHHLYDINLTIPVYFWRDCDYQQAAECAGLQLLRAHVPLGSSTDGPWMDETDPSKAPFVVYVWRTLHESERLPPDTIDCRIPELSVVWKVPVEAVGESFTPGSGAKAILKPFELPRASSVCSLVSCQIDNLGSVFGESSPRIYSGKEDM